MLNCVVIQGRLTADPKIDLVGEGIPFCAFTVAWDNGYKDNKRRVLFMRCKAWRHTAEFIVDYFKKGKEIIVEGNLITEQWEKDGQKRSWEVLSVNHANFCGSPEKKVFDPEKDFEEASEGDGDLPF